MRKPCTSCGHVRRCHRIGMVPPLCVSCYLKDMNNASAQGRTIRTIALGVSALADLGFEILSRLDKLERRPDEDEERAGESSDTNRESDHS